MPVTPCTEQATIGGRMNLPRSCYIAPEPVPDYHTACPQKRDRNMSPEIMSISEQYMAGASDYSDAGNTFPRYSTDAAVSSSHHGHKDGDASREFILKRFFPAARAMTVTERSKSSAPTPPLPASQHRSASSARRYSSSGTRTSSQPESFESVASSRSKSRYIDEVKQDVMSGFSDEDEEPFSAVCGFPLHLRRLAMLQFRCNSFWTSSRSGCRGSKARRTPHNVDSVKTRSVQDDVSDNSDDLFWSDEEAFEDLVLNDGMGQAPFMAPTSARSHSMATVHTPNHRGFLGMPRSSNSGEIDQRARQVDRLGTRLTRLISKTNYMESSRNFSTRPAATHLDIPCEAAAVSTYGPSEAAAAPPQKSSGSGTKWMDAVALLRPPPSPTMPSESWLLSTLPPDKFLIVKTLSRKPLRSFIPINPPSEDDSGLLRQVRQTCSLKEHLHGRFRAQACKRSDYDVIIQRYVRGLYDIEIVHSVVAHMVPSMMIKSILESGQQC